MANSQTQRIITSEYSPNSVGKLCPGCHKKINPDSTYCVGCQADMVTRFQHVAALRKGNLGYSIILQYFTMGFYPMFWFLRRYKEINELNERCKFSLTSPLRPTTTVSFIIMHFLFFIGLFILPSDIPENSPWMFVIMYALAYPIALWIWIPLYCFRVSKIISRYLQNQIPFSGWATFFLFVLYLQYKLDQISSLPGFNNTVATNNAGAMNQEAAENPELAKLLEEGNAKLQFFLALKKTIRDPHVGPKLDRIAELINQILQDLRDDPRDFQIAQRFLSYHLDSIITITKQYAKLITKGFGTPEIENSLAKTIETFNILETALTNLLTKMLDNDIQDLNVELSVLEKSFNLDGINTKG